MRMPLIHTAEIRWFLGAARSGDVREWFVERFGSVSMERRTDRYLVLPGMGPVGIKLRAHASFEVKVRTAEPRHLSTVHGVSGYAECWTKWTCGGMSVVEAMTKETEVDGQWIDVHKHRRICRLAIVDGHVTRLEWGQVVEHGGHVELTSVEVGDHEDCTLGLEAWGAANHVRSLLDRVIENVLGTSPPAGLTLERSFSYPGWLELTVPAAA